METTELQLEQDKLKSELAVLQLRGNRALAAEDVKEAASAAAEMRVVQAKLAFTRHTFGPEPCYVARNPITFQSHKFSTRDYHVLISLDEERPLGDVFDDLVAAGTLNRDQEEEFHAIGPRRGFSISCGRERRRSLEAVEGVADSSLTWRWDGDAPCVAGLCHSKSGDSCLVGRMEQRGVQGPP